MFRRPYHRSLWLAGLSIPLGLAISFPWPGPGKSQPGAEAGLLISSAIYFVLWCAAMWNLILDEKSGYASWKISVSCLLLALGIAAPAILSAALLIHLAS